MGALEENESGFMRGSSTVSQRTLHDRVFRDDSLCYLKCTMISIHEHGELKHAYNLIQKVSNRPAMQ